MRIGVVQQKVDLGRVDVNLERAGRSIQSAIDLGAEMVLLPEFFNSGIAFHTDMLSVPDYGKITRSFLQSVAKETGVPIGGSFLILDGCDAYNVFLLVFPDGEMFEHRKDSPTMVENAYYVGGCDDGCFNTPIGRIGIVLCWEMLRSRTVMRLANRVGVLFAASCWWGHYEPVDNEKMELHERNLEMLRSAPRTIAKHLHVPVIHASCVGQFVAASLSNPNSERKQCFLGQSQVVGAGGETIRKARAGYRSDVFVSDVAVRRISNERSQFDSFWINDMSEHHLAVWTRDAVLGRQYYDDVSQPYYRRRKAELDLPAVDWIAHNE
jgi:predicted amidohydrolase